MCNDRIEIGDTVCVNFTTSVSVIGTVLYIPQATGDSCIIQQEGGHIVYVQMFERMDLLRKKE